MNRKLKTIGAAMLAAAMCASLAGCAKEEEKPKLTESNIESHLESVFGNNSNNNPPSQDSTTSESEIKYEMTDEIKNAALDSGFIQINNEVFQQGGYITVADFVEKYKDSYDITYESSGLKKGTYEDCKEFLVEYLELNRYFDTTMVAGMAMKQPYALKLTPKNGDNKSLRSLYAVIGNFTSPDEKIALDNAIVIGYMRSYDGVSTSTETIHSIWLPEGFGLTGNLNTTVNTVLSKVPDDMEMVNGNYTNKTFFEYLEQKGFSSAEKTPKYITNEKASDVDKKYRTTDNGNIYVYCVGETNLFGKKPVYNYYFSINSDTDKVDDISLWLIGFVD